MRTTHAQKYVHMCAIWPGETSTCHADPKQFHVVRELFGLAANCVPGTAGTTILCRLHRCHDNIAMSIVRASECVSSSLQDHNSFEICRVAEAIEMNHKTAWMLGVWAERAMPTSDKIPCVKLHKPIACVHGCRHRNRQVFVLVPCHDKGLHLASTGTNDFP